MSPNSDSIVRSERLELIPWSAELVDAFIAGDRIAAERALDIVFAEPFAPPPETGDVLDFFRQVIVGDDSGGAYLPRMIVRRADRMALGSIGCMSPDADGASFYGYGIYPQFEGNGYASEAAALLVEWALALPEVKTVRATIPVGHVASEIVSTRAGLTSTGRVETDGEMTLNVWERSK